MKTALLKKLLFSALADIIHKNSQCGRTWEILSSLCTKLEPARSKTGEILEIKILVPILFIRAT